jgi:hypothetical protein
MVSNKVIAVDDTWSGLRFVVRKEKPEELVDSRLRKTTALRR